MKTRIKSILNFLMGLLNFFKFYYFDYKKIQNSKFVFFFPYYHTGGAERVHLNILETLKQERCCVIFTHRSATKNFYEQFSLHADIIELNAIRNKKSRYISKRLKENLSESINTSKEIEVVFGCNTNYYYDILPLIHTSKKRIDLIHAIAPDDERKGALIKSAELLDLRVVINSKTKQDIINIYKEGGLETRLVNKVKIIENGIHISEKDKIKTKNFKDIKIGFIGRWSDEKRPQIFLEIAKRIKNKYPEVEFLMAGTGMKSNLNQINKAGVAFLGEITKNQDLQSLYESLSFLLITSVYEGFPMVVMESMVHGVIPICTDVGGIKEHILHMENGILIDSNEERELVEGFTNHVTFLIEDKKMASKISDQAFNYAVKHFSIEKFNTAYQKIFK